MYEYSYFDYIVPDVHIEKEKKNVKKKHNVENNDNHWYLPFAFTLYIQS